MSSCAKAELLIPCTGRQGRVLWRSSHWWPRSREGLPRQPFRGGADGSENGKPIT